MKNGEAKKMELSVVIARIISVVYLSSALGAILNRDLYRRVFDDFFKNAALTYFMGFMAVLLGSLMVIYHNHWVKDWTVLVTMLGWLALMKGILIIAFPGFVQKYATLIFEGRSLKYFPCISLFFGLLFGYFGFVR